MNILDSETAQKQLKIGISAPERGGALRDMIRVEVGVWYFKTRGWGKIGGGLPRKLPQV